MPALFLVFGIGKNHSCKIIVFLGPCQGWLCYSGIHKQIAFSKSRCTLGTLGPVARCRVSELWSDDPDQPCSPPQRVTGLYLSSVSGKVQG